MSASVWAVVPVKNPSDAKQRLGDALAAPERESLFRAMAADVFDALHGAARLDGVLVVTRDEAIAAAATALGFEVHEESANDGHSTFA